MADLWTIDEIVAATGGVVDGQPPSAFGGVTIDSRAVQPRDIFVAIKGDRLDGHDFAAAALAAGAGIAIVSRPDPAMRAAGPLLVVDDALEALGRLGRAARARTSSRVIAVTGSVGKTTTKEALRLALSGQGETHASASSFNNHWGVPLSLARLPRSARFAVFEIGMNHAGEILPLTALVRPHVAVVTEIAPSHLGHFPSLEAIADAKAEIFTGVEPGGVAVLNRDSPFFGRLEGAARQAGITEVVGFGRNEASDVRLKSVALHETCSCVTAVVFGDELIYKLGSPGEHLVMNSLAVLAAARLAGGDLARSALALAALTPPKGRGVRFTVKLPEGEAVVIDESYNANPVSVAAALAVLSRARPGRGGRRIAVLGDMLELGAEGPALHAGLAKAIDGSGVDVLYASGPLMRHLWDAVPASRRGRHVATSEELKEPLLRELKDGDVIMVKGSLGSRMGPLVEAIRTRFPSAAGGA
ncbi:MAG TPA: UDP-N-acetylmuramoylalanyl-D-glutamyl-2,6-diaminopimelate--D-alanyl-D-alanine ligase [Aestuariivirgaceae bacterium]|nr:UDP-N-acetylmuramoylalanyl-D-glutamyl-2,6-diaminopimelate--D-alanyl-D-alanine ligase [Aestuariivirgaceae bacterium]